MTCDTETVTLRAKTVITVTNYYVLCPGNRMYPEFQVLSHLGTILM